MTTDSAEQAALPDGTIIDGRYRLTGRLGRGGFAWVYEAEHADLERPAAVKLLDAPRDKTSAEFAERFLREARIVARLNHPNVVTVYDFGVHEPTGQPYLAMELLSGRDLEEELATRGPIAPARAKRLFTGALEALRVAHDVGVVHKDLKPSNLFIVQPDTASERMVLLDFGIAWAFDEDSRITQAGVFTGTPAYVAPEYARHQQVSSALDVYQIGLILSEALSGVRCVERDTPLQMLFAHTSGELRIPDSVSSSPFGPLIAKATAVEPGDRYADGGEFVRALAQIDPVSTPADSSPATLEEPLRETEQRPAPRTTARTLPRPEPSEELGWPWYVAGALGLAVIAGVAFVATREGPAPPMPEPPPRQLPAMKTAQEPVGDEPSTILQPDMSEELALLPRFIVSTTPIGAAVFRGEEQLGRTPLVLRGDAVDGSRAKLRIELDGHKPTTRTVKLDRDGRLDVELESLRKAGGDRSGPSRAEQDSAQRGFMQMIQGGGFKQPPPPTRPRGFPKPRQRKPDRKRSPTGGSKEIKLNAN